ncbi:alpha-amylase [Cryobacterium tagatosivorans]|uniref:alpha-amylase n=1 Tax=Cryobacterium tagatosivorans TaxID=1259199 RepID=UPI00141BBE96|nr:alpha-amylase family protein [Cryobacterium tagatosivorans]
MSHRTPIAAAAALIAASVTLLAGCSGPAPAVRPAADRPAGTHDVGVELFQWNWDSIARECTDNLGPAGIAWVLASPPNEHVTGPEWWTSYQPVSYRVESRLGTRDQFASMVATCHEAGVDVLADAVLNHMTGRDAAGVGWAESSHEHYDYPGLYSDAAGDFHHCGRGEGDDITTYRAAFDVQNCELVNLADLATETTHVRGTLTAYLADLLSLGVDGFRIDAAKHIAAADLAAILAPLPPDTYVVQEVIRGSREAVQPEMYTGNGDVFEFGFARELEGMVESGTMSVSEGFGEDWGFLPGRVARTFVDNHDTERNGETLNYTDGAEYVLANVLTLALPYGAPVLYSGYAFSPGDDGPAQDASGRVEDADCGTVGPAERYADGDWVCQHRWDAIAGMVSWRSAVGDAPLVNSWTRGDGYAFSRGERGFVAMNAGDAPLARRFQTGLASGTYCDVVTGGSTPTAAEACSGDAVEVAADGTASLSVPPVGAVAIHVGARLS